jgi:CBS domain-containing protein
MRARSIMSTTLHTVERATPIVDVIRLLLEHEISGVPVVEDGRVVGIVSEGDLILRERARRPRGGMAYLAQQLFEDHAKLAEEYKKAHGLVAEDVMTRDVVTVLPGTPIEEVARLLAERNIKRVPVVEDGRLVGIVSRRDVLRATARRLVGEDRAHPSGEVSDEAIVRRLLDALRGEPWAEVNLLTPISEDGIVTLRGDVESAVERDAIEIAARGIPGVRGVRNELRIRPDIADEA